MALKLGFTDCQFDYNEEDDQSALNKSESTKPEQADHEINIRSEDVFYDKPVPYRLTLRFDPSSGETTAGYAEKAAMVAKTLIQSNRYGQ